MASVQLLTDADATNNKPTVTDGVTTDGALLGDLWNAGKVVLLIKNTDAEESTTKSVTIRLWGFSQVSTTWVPLGVGGAATKGFANAGAACGETGTDIVTHAEVVDGLFGIERVYAEVTAIGGALTTISAWLVNTRI